MEIVLLGIGIVVGFAIGWLVRKNQQPQNNQGDITQQLNAANGQISGLSSTNTYLTDERDRLSAETKQQQQHILELNTALTTSKSSVTHLEERLAEQKGELEKLNERFKTEFENLATRILEEKSQKFTEQNKQSIDGILTPLRDRIKDFEEKVQKVYDTEAAERNVLKGEIKQLMSLNQVMHQDAQNLTKALKGDTKIQGNWGEFILESILEKSGLVKDREYQTQQSITTEDGKRYQPDVVINLPDGKCLIIDSKVSLIAYERFVNAADDIQKAAALKEHGQSLKAHIKGLSDKNYHQLYGIKSLDFVLLFIPIEPAFAAAMQLDNQLFNDAFERNIVIVSPSTLLATLRTVANIWRQENQNKNAIEIASKAGDMYEKFVGFTDDLISLGAKMRDSQKVYEGAMNKLTEGTGNLVKRAEGLKKLGAKTSKSIDPRLLDRADLD